MRQRLLSYSSESVAATPLLSGIGQSLRNYRCQRQEEQSLRSQLAERVPVIKRRRFDPLQSRFINALS